ncbi:hypothetical protein ND748_08000, partial [Frankia sp. AiPs1]
MPSFGDSVNLALHLSEHGTGGNRVAFDPARLRTLAAAVRSAAEALHTSARIVAHALAQVGGPGGWAARLARLGDELDADAAMLRHRLALAEGADDAGRSLLPAAAAIAPAVQHSRSLLDDQAGLVAQPVLVTGVIHGAEVRPDSDADHETRPGGDADPRVDTAAESAAVLVPVAGRGGGPPGGAGPGDADHASRRRAPDGR